MPEKNCPPITLATKCTPILNYGILTQPVTQLCTMYFTCPWKCNNCHSLLTTLVLVL